VVKLHGGANGIRDINGLESAIARPYQTFGGEDLYPSCYEKGSSYKHVIPSGAVFVKN
jgi:death-on-curing protein